LSFSGSPDNGVTGTLEDTLSTMLNGQGSFNRFNPPVRYDQEREPRLDPLWKL
jgi:hypothetical protein